MSKKRAGKYFIFGVINTAIGYGIYEILALTIFSGEKYLPLAALVSGAVSIFTGYYVHSRFTWKGRQIGKKVLTKFFIWNVITSIAIKPALTAFFTLRIFNWLYNLAFNICQFLHLPFSYDFVMTTGNFVLVTAVIMVINFLVYDRFVFGKKVEKAEVVARESEEEPEQ